jgi:TetR/AcrR family transcriptional regulator, transcriptional repressor for nem operon
MRRSRLEAAATRRRAVETASRLYRERGLDGVSVGDVMGAIGMTVGGFYRHFESKEALVTEACDRAFDEARQHQEAAAASAEEDPLTAVFSRYLSRAHRDAPASGCPIPSLLSSVPRQPPPVRHAFTESIRRTLARIERLSPGAEPAARTAAVASMFGALALARAVDDEELSTRLLHQTRSYWSRTLGKQPSPEPAGTRSGQPGSPATPRRRERG